MTEIKVFIDDKKNIVPIDDYEKSLIKGKQGKVYRCRLDSKRILKHHRKYWLLMKALEFHFSKDVIDEDGEIYQTQTAEGWNLFFKSKFLPMIEFNLPSGRKILYPSSIAFEKMSQEEFDKYYKNIDDYLLNNGHEINELIQTMEI